LPKCPGQRQIVEAMNENGVIVGHVREIFFILFEIEGRSPVEFLVENNPPERAFAQTKHPTSIHFSEFPIQQ
jgi:hypothetical protein